jgi:hypothetical protein
MDLPVRDRILSHIESALRTVATFRAVDRAQLPYRPQAVLPAAIVYTGRETKDDLADGVTQCELEVIIAVVAESRRDLESEAAVFIQDVERVLMEDRTQGGLALFTTSPDNQIFAAEISKPQFSIEMMTRITYGQVTGRTDQTLTERED